MEQSITKDGFILVPIPAALLTKNSGMREQLKLEKITGKFRETRKMGNACICVGVVSS